MRVISEGRPLVNVGAYHGGTRKPAQERKKPPDPLPKGWDTGGSAVDSFIARCRQLACAAALFFMGLIRAVPVITTVPS